MGGSKELCVFCEVLWVGPNECVFTVMFCGWVRSSV